MLNSGLSGPGLSPGQGHYINLSSWARHLLLITLTSFLFLDVFDSQNKIKTILLCSYSGQSHMTLTMLEWLQRRLNIINDTGLMSLGVAIRGTFRGGAKEGNTKD